MNEKVYTNKYTNKMKNAPLFWLFLLSIGWPCAMVLGCWLSDGWRLCWFALDRFAAWFAPKTPV